MNSSKDTHKTTKKKNKVKYIPKNWSKYNKSLVARGSITLWIDEDITDWWYEEGKKTYSDRAIETMLIFKSLYGMPLRMLEGYIQSLFDSMKIPLDVPNYSTVSRRAQKLNIKLKKQNKQITDIILDSTGCKLYGEGEWKVRKHGWNYRRTWKKLNIGIDADGEIRTVVVNDNHSHDSIVIDESLQQEPSIIRSFYGDGGYDFASVYMSLQGREVENILIPPRVDAKIKIHGNTKGPPYARDENLRAIRKSTRKLWKQSSGYHTRSLVETTMYRYKSTFGDHIYFRTHQSQCNEVITKCNILNTFHRLGMPECSVAEET